MAAPSALATQAGMEVTHAGGTAVDAALASMLTACVTEPGLVSPMGGTFVNIWPADGEPVVIDGNVEMPGCGAEPERFGGGIIGCRTDYAGGITINVGPGSVATPGMFAAFERAHTAHGRAPWAEILTPAIAAARDGFTLGSTSAAYLGFVGESVFGWDEQTRAFLTNQDSGRAGAGDLLVNPDLAASLEHVATEGAATLYTGDLAAVIAADMHARGGLITAADLAAYRPVVRPALRTRMQEWDLAGNPPPSIGGPVLIAMLRLLASLPEVTTRDVVDVQRRVLDLRLHRVDIAPDLEVAGHELLETIESYGLTGLPTSSATAHVSVVDTDGLACAVTTSAGYGSGATVPGTGLQLNNALGEPELNRRGLHTLPPGTRLASNMAPTTGRHRDGSRLAIGTPGADRITTALMQVLTRYCGGESIQAAVDAARVHVRHFDDGTVRIDHEWDEELAAALAGHELARFEHDRHAMYFGGVGAAVLSAEGVLSAAADPRRAAATAVD